MAFQKYQKAEKAVVVPKDDSEAIRKIVKEAGVQSAADLTDEQRAKLSS